jgi:hypothetical protein
LEKNITATFKKMNDLELAAEELRKQGVLDLRFDDSNPIKIDYQSNNLIEALGDSLLGESYALQVSVEKSRYRQAEDTIAKFGGEF